MNFENKIRRPYFACGGFCKNDVWYFFTPFGEVKISGCSDLISVILPLCNGQNELTFITRTLKEKFRRKDITKALSALFDHLILVDSNRIFQIFYAYSRNPMPFSESIKEEETRALIGDKSHLPRINGERKKMSLAKSSLREAMNERCSSRDFSGKDISEKTIFSILWSSYGAQSKRNDSTSKFLGKTFTVPSGGALYPLFLYLFLFKQCNSLDCGLYLWHKEEEILEVVKSGNFVSDLERIVNGISTLKKATGLVCVVADFERSAKKYGNKAYNLIQQEVGHVMQNMALLCVEQGLGVVEIGGYEDESLANFLGINFPNQAPLIVAAFGGKGG